MKNIYNIILATLVLFSSISCSFYKEYQRGGITEIPAEYITESELNAKGYLTEHQSLDDYAKKTDLFSKDYNDLTNKPTIPSVVGLASESYVDTKVAGIVNSAPATLDTLNELAKALGNDANFSATVSTQIGNKVDKVSGKGLSTNDFTTAEKNKLAGLSTVATSGSYNDLKDKPTIPSIEGLATEEFVTDKIGSLPSTSGGGGIIDVVELPTEDINESALYRKLTGIFVYNKYRNNTFTCHCVETLPEVGEPATTDMTTITAYYNVADGACYGYVDDMLSSALSVPAGWYDMSALLPVAGFPYGGVVTSLEDASAQDTIYLLLEYVIYSYKDGWASLKPIGRSGTGPDAEVFNHISNIASGDCDHAEGYCTIASGGDSHAEGCLTTASGENSHAEGAGTTASGHCSHAEGDKTIAASHASHAEGHGTIANGGWAQHVQGTYNIEDEAKTELYSRGKYAHIVGNGRGEDKRSNAHTLDWNGNAWYQGDVYTGGTGQDDTTAKKLATEDYVKTYVENAILGGSW